MAGPPPRDGITYSDYLKIPELLELQQCEVPEAHDEMQFIVVHQVYELWFRLIMHEVDHIAELFRRGTDVDLRNATRLCRRIHRIFLVLVDQIHVLESMRPSDFLAFRSALNPASGFQSVQFRELEAAMGLRDERLASFTAGDPRHGALRARMAAPSVSDALYEALRARGHDVRTPTESRSDAEQDSTLEALRVIYDAPDDHPLEYELCEALVEIDEQVVLWRRHHVMMVERHMGDKPGTGKGTTGDLDGIRYLKTTLMRKAFPDLWAVRSILTD